MILVSFLYLLIRLFFLRSYPVFYDSFEYFKIAESINLSNFTQLIATSHQPIHTLYFLTILFFKQVFFFFSVDKILVLISLVSGYLTLIFWYLFIKEYLDAKKAFFASLLLLVFPYFFIINTNILYESELLFFQILGIYFFFLGTKKKKIILACLAGLSWGLSVSVFIGSLLLLPVLFSFCRKSKKFFLYFLLTLTLSLLLTFLLDWSIFRSLPLIFDKYQPHFGDLASTQGGLFVFIYRVLRNIVFESIAILSPAGAIVLILTIAIYSLNTYFLLLNTLLWFAPPLLLMQFWHAGLFGRLAIFLIFPASLLLTKNIVKSWQKYLLLLFLLLFLIPHLLAQKQTPPVYLFYNLIKDIPNIAVITSDSNRFLYQKNSLPIFVLGPGNNLTEAEGFIKDNLKSGKIVLVDSAGLKYPYFQFDGDNYQLLSKRKSGQSHIQPLLEKFKRETFKIDEKNSEIFFLRVKN